MRVVAIALLVLAEASVAHAQSAPAATVRFQPRLVLQPTPVTPLYEHRAKPPESSQPVHVVHHAAQPRSAAVDTQVICGMTVIRKTPDTDPKILIKPERAGAAVRKIEPKVCTNPER